MKRDGHENASYFLGPEVEHTPAYSKRTLFVVGKQPVDQIIEMARANRATHVFMGANHSFDIDPEDNTFYWDKTITNLLDRGFWVTLDYPSYIHGNVQMMLNKGIWQSRQFVPLLSVRIPNIQTSSVNLTVKIDDIDFNATNPGVWCLHHHELTDSNRFTDWQEYGSDEVLEPVAGPASPLPLKIQVTETKVAPTVYADINKPALDLEAVRAAIEAQKPADEEVKNDPTVGLDPTSPSQLKEESAEEIKSIQDITSPPDAAEAYAAGATEDPLAGKAPKKVGKK